METHFIINAGKNWLKKKLEGNGGITGSLPA